MKKIKYFLFVLFIVLGALSKAPSCANQWQKDVSVLRKGGSLKEVIDCFRRHPDWSGLFPSVTARLRRKAEKASFFQKYGLCKKEIVSFFKVYPPLTCAGWQLYIQLCPEAIQHLRAFWKSHKIPSLEEEKIIEKKFRSSLTPKDHEERLQFLLKTDSVSLAKTLKNRCYLIPRHRPLYLELVSSHTPSSAEALRKKVEDLSQEDKDIPSFAVFYVRFLLANRFLEEASKVWQHVCRQKGGLASSALDIRIAKEFFQEGRHALAEGREKEGRALFRKSLEALREVPIPPIYEGWEEGNFLAALILLEGLQDPLGAMSCLDMVLFPSKMYFGKKSDILHTSSFFKKRHQCKAFYWKGRCAEALGLNTKEGYYAVSAGLRHQSLYGWLSQAKLGKPLTIAFSRPVSLRKADNSVVMRVLEIMKEVDLQEKKEGHSPDILNFFMNDLRSLLKGGDADFALNAFREMLPARVPYYAKLYGYDHDLPFQEAYPQIFLINDLGDPALLHALICTESSFDTYTHGDADERGLMQVLPESGEEAAARLGIRFQLKKLYERDYNITIGAEELRDCMEKFSNHYVPSIAAYNAGITRVKGWIKKFPPPSSLDQIVYWIESIPYLSVRDYVQKLLSDYLIYRHLMDRPVKKIDSLLKIR